MCSKVVLGLCFECNHVRRLIDILDYFMRSVHKYEGSACLLAIYMDGVLTMKITKAFGCTLQLRWKKKTRQDKPTIETDFVEEKRNKV